MQRDSDLYTVAMRQKSNRRHHHCNLTSLQAERSRPPVFQPHSDCAPAVSCSLIRRPRTWPSRALQSCQLSGEARLGPTQGRPSIDHRCDLAEMCTRRDGEVQDSRLICSIEPGGFLTSSQDCKGNWRRDEQPGLLDMRIRICAYM